jgi:hypothetical protein
MIILHAHAPARSRVGLRPALGAWWYLRRSARRGRVIKGLDFGPAPPPPPPSLPPPVVRSPSQKLAQTTVKDDVIPYAAYRKTRLETVRESLGLGPRQAPVSGASLKYEE